MARTEPPMFHSPAYQNRESQFYYTHLTECKSCLNDWLSRNSSNYDELKTMVLANHDIV